MPGKPLVDEDAAPPLSEQQRARLTAPAARVRWVSAPPGKQRGPAPATEADPNRCDADTKQNVSLDGTAALRLIQRHTSTTDWHVVGRVTRVTAGSGRGGRGVPLPVLLGCPAPRARRAAVARRRPATHRVRLSGRAAHGCGRVSTTDAVLVDLNRLRSLYLAPHLRKSLPPAVVEGFARRPMIALGQTCPCGARTEVPNRAERRGARRPDGSPRYAVMHWAPIEQRADCPASCPQFLSERWST